MQIKYGAKFLYSVYLIFILLTQNSFAEEWQGACETFFPPFNYIDKDGERVGMDTEIIALVMKKLGIKYSTKDASWEQVYSLLKNEKVDFAWPFVRTSERRKLFYLIGPFRYSFDVFVVKKDSKISNWHFLSDFKGQKVGVIKKYNYTRDFDNYKDFTKKEFNNVEDLLTGLIKGDADFIIGDFYSLTYVSRKYDYTNKIRFLPSSIKKNPRYIAFSKINKSKSIIFESALNEVMKSKEFQDIIDKYN